MAETETSGIVFCSKCRKNPAAYPESSSPWCKECRAKYQKEYTVMRESRSRAEGFAAGVKAMREAASSRLTSLGPFSQVSGPAAAAVVRELAVPVPD